ncbi:hypothetical protein M2390_001812 [Mycetocola sp. BIGb0189]|uniref:hypothetical protein n=1 Tax=Mycetocola sp. BIGb0189 TaxID=2940604 RepID=UPI00216AA95E|nr:hypothetical protein [Mycetocola sp. BIGb0189]MCS4276618.1 hypothetical protein [Mycetocola sp. BIGb0189]
MTTQAEFSAALTPQARAQWITLSTAISAELEGAPALAREDLERLTFPAIPPAHHPFSDAEEIFWAATDGIAPDLAGTGEFPLLFLGFSSLNRITRSREPVGFLLTSGAVYVRDSPSGLFGTQAPRIVPLFSGPEGIAASAQAITEQAIARFEWKWAHQVASAEVWSAALQRLSSMVALVLALLPTLGGGVATEAPASATSLPERLRELGLGDIVVLGSDESPKRLKQRAKLVKVLKLTAAEPILLSITDSTLAGPYGSVLTGEAIHSRDLMKDPVSTPRAGIDPAAIRAEKDRLIVAPGEVHTLPSFLTESQREDVVRLLREIIEGRLSL